MGSTKTLLCACSRVHSSVSATCDCCVFKFLRRNMDGKHFIRSLVWTKNIWCVFRVKTPFSNSSGVVWTGPYWLMNVRQVKLLLPQSCSPAVPQSRSRVIMKVKRVKQLLTPPRTPVVRKKKVLNGCRIEMPFSVDDMYTFVTTHSLGSSVSTRNKRACSIIFLQYQQAWTQFWSRRFHK